MGDASDSRKLGHLTVAYKGSNGLRRHHTVALYHELTSSGAAQERVLNGAMDYLDSLREAIGDAAPFNAAAFAAMFTDRGASLGHFDAVIPRLFEPLHRVNLTITNVVASYEATAVSCIACRAAVWAATSPVFQSYMVASAPSVGRRVCQITCIICA